MARRIHEVKRSTRKSLWLQFQPIVIAHSGASTATLAFTLNAAALALLSFTVVRTHFEMALRSDQAAALESQTASLGIAVVFAEAAALGITAIPTPTTAAGSSLWFVHQFLFAQASEVTDLTLPQERISIDSKAMRKMEVGTDMVVVVQGGGVGNGQTITIGGRILIKTN